MSGKKLKTPKGEVRMHEIEGTCNQMVGAFVEILSVEERRESDYMEGDG